MTILKGLIKAYTEELNKSHQLIIVDVQPHDVGKFINFNMSEFAKFVNSFDEVLVLFNGSGLGWESLEEMEDYYEDIGIDISKCDFVEKSYAFLRSWMDEGVDKNIIVNVLKYMIENNYDNSTEIPDDELTELGGDHQDGDIWIEDGLEHALKQFSGAVICGGGKSECLAEIELVMDAYNIPYTENSKFIYG